jgi:hypothetical protein
MKKQKRGKSVPGTSARSFIICDTSRVDIDHVIDVCRFAGRSKPDPRGSAATGWTSIRYEQASSRLARGRGTIET